MLFVGYGSKVGPSTLAFGGVDSQNNRVTSVQADQILFDGVPAPIYYVSATQVADWVPYSVAGKTSIQVTVQFKWSNHCALIGASGPRKSRDFFGELLRLGTGCGPESGWLG